MQNESYQIDLTAADETPQQVKPVYGNKRRTVVKSLLAVGACAACVVLGVKMERHGHAQNIEGMFASSVMARAPVVSVTTASVRGPRKTNMRATSQPMRQQSRLNAEADGDKVVVGETTTPADGAATEEDKETYKTATGEVLNFKPRMSEAIPFIEAAAHLDGTMVGDRGLDPFNFGADGKLERMREAEIKHARLAMLAAAGWPISEKLDTPLAKLVNLPVALNSDGTAPSPLHGGLDDISVLYWGAVLGASVAIEFAGRNNKEAGDYGWDPLKLAEGKTIEEMRNMKEKELKNGRLAMMAIAGFAVQEALYSTPVTQETPAFFQPIWETLSQN